MENENILFDELSAEEELAQEAAFAAGFAADRGEEVVQAEPMPEPEPEVQVEPESPPEPPKVFAGLTEEQLTTALGRSSALQSTVDKMAGRIGQLMQQIDSLRTAPTVTAASQVALDLKLEKLSSQFPELAELLREDLQALRAPAPVEQPAAPAAAAFDQSALEARIDEKLEVRVLTIMHPDWLEVARSPQFALWRDNVLGGEAGKQLMGSEDAGFISNKLTEYKRWRDATKAEPPVVTPIVSAKAARLANAVMPNTTPTTTSSNAVMDEETAFMAGFKAEQKRRGYGG